MSEERALIQRRSVLKTFLVVGALTSAGLASGNAARASALPEDTPASDPSAVIPTYSIIGLL